MSAKRTTIQLEAYARCVTLQAIQLVADDNEAQMVEDLAVRAKLWWKCNCNGWVNDKTDKVCGNCGGKFRNRNKGEPG